MDTIFSAYKHEFPAGALDYTSSFASLSDLYHSYRDLIVSLFFLVIERSDLTDSLILVCTKLEPLGQDITRKNYTHPI